LTTITAAHHTTNRYRTTMNVPRAGCNPHLLLALLLPTVGHAQSFPTLFSPTPEQFGGFGASVAGVPDVDGDGVPDLLVGAAGEDGGEADAGRAYLFSGATNALIRTLSSPNPEASGHFGFSVAGVADADGDGRGDLLVGAPEEDGGATGAGRAYLFSGASGALLRTLESPNAEEGGTFGFSISGVGDVDGDGRGDLLVGAYLETVVVPDAGQAYLYSGASGAFLRSFVSFNVEPNGQFGHSVTAVPDADGDGRDDLLIGAFLEDGGAEDAGRAYLFSGASGALLRTLESPEIQVNGHFGHGLGGVPDADGDGRGDLLIGANLEDGGEENAGRAYLISGATGALLHTLDNPEPLQDAYFGFSTDGVPDVDGDGRGELLVGAGFETGNAANARRAYVFSGRTGDLLTTIRSPNPQPFSSFGFAVAGLGDVDGDGRGEALVGAFQEDVDGLQGVGRAYLVHGALIVASEPGPGAPEIGVVAAPNPALGRAAFTLTLPAPGSVRLSVLDVLGREVAVLVDGALAAGAHDVAFEARGLAGGTYVWRLDAGGAVQSGRFTLID
jgi:hypothetical protein